MKSRFVFFLVIDLMVSLSVSSQTPEIMWWFDVNDMSFGNSALADVDKDGKPEIVFSCYRNDSSVYVLNAEDGTLLWKKNTGGCNDVAPVIFDVDDDGDPEIILPGSCVPKTLCLDGATGETEWVVNTHGSDSPPTIGDIDGDGDVEILHGEFNGYVICISGKTGSVEWQFLVSDSCWIQTAPALIELDGDGLPDFVVANWHFGEKHRIYAFRGYDHAPLWESDLPQDVMYHGASFADIDKDGKPELAIGSYDGTLYILNGEDGSLYAQYAFPSPYYIGAPTSIADLNNDGFFEIVFIDWFKVGVLSHEGELLWDYSIPGYASSFRGAAISDINNDLIPDLVFGTSSGHLMALQGDNGYLIWDVDLQSHFGPNEFDIDHGPVIADFDGNGFIDVFVVGGHAEYPNVQNNYGRGYAVSCGSPGGPEWPMFRRDIRRSACVNDSVTTVIRPDPEHAGFRCFPNPACSILQIRPDNDLKLKTVLLSDLYGHTVLSMEVDQGKGNDVIGLNISTLDPGLYFVRLSGEAAQYLEKICVVR
ncbi:MAG: VCBS repeat-containing protein [Bacteroidales bacterium]|nr:VCBS repeat-containing protein [Bacteroidales bacterium]